MSLENELRVLELLPDPFTQRDYMRVMRVSRWTAGRFCKAVTEQGLARRSQERPGTLIHYHKEFS